jgi:hypothetical protein
MAKQNSTLAKRFGQPKNVSDGTGGRSTLAAGRPAVNGSIVSGKFGCKPNDYGTSSHGIKGWANRGLRK